MEPQMPDSSYCRVAFDEARQQRSQSPFSEGASKLRETEDTLKRMGETIQNIGKRPFIRRLMNITITYDTPPEKIQEATDILKKILDKHEGMHADLPPKVYFSGLNSDSLNLLAIYWYHPPEYWQYMDFSQKVNFEIIKQFNEAGIDFAFPTQTVYVAGDKNRPLDFGLHKVKESPEK
jgi:MscS family membrane protein